ncbi:CLIP-associating protein 1-like [Rhopalosiphum padi]|uniref:CLIP-associating protein 1-like n=1 Tax=Rhopalosiphum padi TaxID=40932 RepID=UPI00298E91A9|nr:CLIP-associating protein 1-like [Rhopalosiphum padi]
MAAGLPHDLDGFIPLLLTSDIRMKVTVGCKLFTYLEEPSNSIECSDIGMLIDGIVQWLLNSNPKVAQYGIEIITQLINRMKIDFRPYISTILPIAIDRIGDSKEPIKVKTLFLIMKLMECNTISPQALFDQISVNAFNHKNSSVKEGSMKLLLLTIEEFGANCIAVSKILPIIIKLLSDPNVQVRQKAFETLVDLYKHIGEKLRIYIQKHYSIPQNKMTDLMNKFDEVKITVNLLPTTSDGLNLTNDDEPDHACTFAPKYVIGSIKRPTSFLPLKSNSTTPLQQVDFVRKSTSSSVLSASHACGVDEDTFIRSFEDVPTLTIFSVRDLDDTMKQIHKSIQDSNEQWNKRVDSLKKIRSLVLNGATKYDEFFNNLRYLEHSFQISIKDLRSQVIRETCVTIAFLSQRLGNKFNHFSESVFSNLIDLIQNSAKVTASSGLVAIRFILEYSHAPRIILILAKSLGSKSKDIRRACCEFFDQILRKWPSQVVERHINILQDCIKKGIADADSSARMLSRKAYWGFCEHFPEHGEILFNKLEPAYRKILLTNSGSNSCLSKSVIAESSKLTSHRTSSSHSNISIRSRSAIDLQAAKRSKAHTQNATLIRQKFNPVVSNQSVSKKINEYIHQMDRKEKSRVRVSLSQSASCSGSPSSKLNFVQTKSYRATSGIPRSRDTSREVSPNRFNIHESHMNSKEPPSSIKPKSIMAQKILIQSQETESAITDAWSYKNYKSPRKVLEGLFNDYSDDSETSSVCSERRIDSRKRFSDSFYLSGSQCGLHKEIWKNSSSKCLNIEDIISSCESSNWNNRKEGLLSLLKYFQQGNIVSKLLLTKITELFTKMFMDSQTKVISLFLDVLNELIITHSRYLEYWLYTLLVKLFNKGGSDILSSVHSKILKTIEIIRLSFSCDLQLTAVFKFLTDPTQTPNVKIKIFAMSYISQLAVSADPGTIFLSVVNDKKDYATLALIKMIGWTTCNSNIKQGPELRRASQEAILALYSLNASQIRLRLSQLPEEYQEVFSRLLKIRERRSSFDQITTLNNHNSQVQTNLASPPLQPDTIDIFNSEEIHKSSKKSTDKVQKYRLKCHYPEELNIDSYESRINQLYIHTETNNHNLNSFNNSLTTVEEIKKIFDDLDKGTLQLHYKQSILIHLKELIKDDYSCELTSHFKKIIKVIFNLLLDIEPIIREHTMILVVYLVQKSELVTYFHDYTELIIMKVLNMCCDSYKSVVKVAEECLIALSVSLHTETVVKIITPLILAKEFPVNLISIRMMTKIVDKYGSPPVTDQIKDIMSGLLQSYDNPDSAVRKSAVFCMVSLYKVFGSHEFIPLISSLNGAKLKLLNLYIERAQQSIKIN